MTTRLDFNQQTQPQDYVVVFQQMKEYTQQRHEKSSDSIWFLEHYPVFTQGQAGKAEHIHHPGDIPVIQSDRGGQVTYHGPGQLMIYTLFDLKRLNIGIKPFVSYLQKCIMLLLKKYDITSHTICEAPGVYVNHAKICSIGLRIRKGKTYHGLSLNVNMDLSPFNRINPCGFEKLQMTQISEYIPQISLQKIIDDLKPILSDELTLLRQTP